MEMGWRDEERERAHKKKTEEMRERERERKREREAANNVWMEAAEVQQVSGEMEGQIEKKLLLHVVETESIWMKVLRAHAVGKMLHKPLK